MATGNFTWQNAGAIYALKDADYYDPETYETLDSWREGCLTYYREWRDELEWAGETKGFKTVEVPNSDRRRENFAIEKAFYIQAAGQELTARGRVFLRPGNYSGASLDWEIYTDEEGEIGDFSEYADDYAGELAGDAMYYAGWNPGIWAMNGDKVRGAVRHQLQAIAAELETFCRENCDEVLAVCGIFSNGGVIYQSA